MILVAYRLSPRQYSRRAFLGEGARRVGGRWNPRGVSAVYASATLSLAALELLAHLSGPQDAPELISFRITFDSKLVTSLELPRNWRQFKRTETRARGSVWFEEANSPVLRVPSFIIPSESNYVLNPMHPEFRKIKIEKPLKFLMDKRLY